MAHGPIGILSAAVYPSPRPDLPHLAVLFEPSGAVLSAVPMATEQEALLHVEQAMREAAALLGEPVHEL